MKRRISPEEVEEPLEPEVNRARRTILPRSVRRDLLQASPSRRSVGSRTGTLTPTPDEVAHNKNATRLASRRPESKLIEADDSQLMAIGDAQASEEVSPAPERASVPRAARSTAIIAIDKSSDQAEPDIVNQRNAEAGPSNSAHGPRSQVQETIIIASDSDQLDNQSSFSSSSSIRPSIRRRKSTIRKCKGAPYVELPFLSLPHIKTFTLPTGIRGPNPLSRNDQINYLQTPPHSPHASSEASAATWQVSQAPRSGLFPRWATMPKDDSSDDLGGYGPNETEDELEWSEEEIEATRRSTRNKGKGKEVESKRPTRATASKPKEYNTRLAHLDLSSSRSNSRDSKIISSNKTRSRRRQDDSSGPPSLISISDSESEGEDEFDPESEASDFDDKPRGKTNRRERKIDHVSDDVLYEHRAFCEKCQRGPADDLLEQAQAKKKRAKGRPKKKHEDDMSDEEIANQLGGWLTCERCVVVSHWGCLTGQMKKEVLLDLQTQEGPVEHGCKKVRGVEIDEEASFLCSKCRDNPKCLVCHEDKLEQANSSAPPDVKNAIDPPPPNEVTKEDETQGDQPKSDLEDTTVKAEGHDEEEDDTEAMLRFRCFRCKQESHYEHLTNPFSTDASLPEIAQHYQQGTDRTHHQWECHQCRAWVWTVDNVIAWRPLPADAKETLEPNEQPNYKDPLPREYLVKWADRGFRHVTWVPHAWLLANSPAKLKNFLIKGATLDLITDETLAAKGDEMAAPTIANLMDEADRVNGNHHQTGDRAKDEWVEGGPPPDVDGMSSLPIAWSTVDRVLDVMLLPQPPQYKGKSKGKGRKNDSRSASADLPDFGDATINMVDGIEPPRDQQIGIEDWERATGRSLDEDDIDEVAKLVTWYYVKWDDLQYDQSTWDTPPPITDTRLYDAYKTALRRYLRDRNIVIPILDKKQCERREIKAEQFTRPPSTQPECIVGGTLMPFQMNGFQWLLTKYFKRESCILADDMGLGKTIQIASLIGYLGSEEHKIYPFLVVVPNSTITNWVREFEKWVPHLRVVPYYGYSSSRKVVTEYELYRKGMKGKAAGLKAHVILTTYDVITGGDFSLFKSIPRWEMLIIDEGQRLKSDTNLIFNRLKTLNTVHRILLTGTPLNNNLRELFNLLNFLDPVNFENLAQIEERFSDLDETLLGELHEMIQPFILRRIKADVLRLPPKIEIIVPISLTPIQKHVYKGILERHADLIQAVMAQRKKRIKPAETSAVVENGTNGTEEPVQTAPVAENGDATMESATAAAAAEVSAREEVSAVPEVGGNGPEVVVDKNVDEAMIVDSDHTDSALVEDTI